MPLRPARHADPCVGQAWLATDGGATDRIRIPLGHRCREPSNWPSQSDRLTGLEHVDHQPVLGSVLAIARAACSRRDDLGGCRLPSRCRPQGSQQRHLDPVTAVFSGTQWHREPVALLPQPLLVKPHLRQTVRRRLHNLVPTRPQPSSHQIRLRQILHH